VLVCVAAFALVADIVTKALVVAHLREGQPVHVLDNVLMFNLLRNPGAAFSVGTGDTIVFTAIAVAVVAYIARTARNLRSTAWAITLGLLLGGALGNLGDRIFRAPGFLRGHVVDWIEVTRFWPVFNLADSAIVCGGILTVLLALLGYRMDGRHAARPATAVTDASSSEPKGAAVADQASEEPPREPKGRPAVWTEERGAQRRVTREDGGLRRPGGERDSGAR
jgi:signal peptidase II